jgi:hypothetical protein
MNFRKSLIVAVLTMGAAAVALAQQAPSTPSTGSTSKSSTSAPGKSETRTAAASGGSFYTVKEGNKVDNATLLGWRTWRALACERCHGAEQEGLVGPPLVESMKKLSKEEFHKTLMDGRPEKGMPPFSASKMVTDNWEGLYGYLKGRADGKIKPGRVVALDAK